MTIQEIAGGGGCLLLALMTLVQIAPIKINPWSWLAKTVGKAVNADMSGRLDGIAAKLDGHIEMDDRRTADGHRAQILHFNNELLRPINHTKEEFIEILTQIDVYEKYCETHPGGLQGAAEEARLPPGERFRPERIGAIKKPPKTGRQELTKCGADSMMGSTEGALLHKRRLAHRYYP